MNSNIQSFEINQTNTKLLCNYSDRILRLYDLRLDNLGLEKRVFILSNDFQDRINKKKFINTRFLKFKPN